jgi:RNA polymerase sigma-70 factor, ECF subfamily
MDRQTDEQLMRQVAKGDHTAFSILVDRHLRRVVSVAQSITGTRTDADDIAQETFLRVWERPRLFDASQALFTTWLHRVTVNLCIDRRRVRRPGSLDEIPEQPMDTVSLVDLLYTAERRAAVGAAMLTLSVQQRTAIALFHMQGFSQREAAAIMELSEGAFESLLQRGRRALALVLGSEEGKGEYGT